MNVIFLTACNGNISTPEKLPEGETRVLNIVATTSIIFDVVNQVGGESIDLELLLPTGADPHNFEPTPQDIVLLSHADVIFINGAGLEAFLEPLIENSGGDFRIEDLSDVIQLIKIDTTSETEDHDPGDYDPHIWMDPKNVILWVERISAVLSELDPVNSTIYEANGQAYKTELLVLDRWIVDTVKSINPENRKLVSDHLVFGYFAKSYDFTQISAILPSFSTLSQPSAQEIAILENNIRDENIKAIFVSESVNPNLSQRIAEDTGIKVVSVYTGSLTEPGGFADNYIDLIRYDVNAIVSALQ